MLSLVKAIRKIGNSKGTIPDAAGLVLDLNTSRIGKADLATRHREIIT